jgi:hypothetical protein
MSEDCSKATAQGGNRMRDIMMLTLTVLCLGGDLFLLELLKFD